MKTIIMILSLFLSDCLTTLQLPSRKPAQVAENQNIFNIKQGVYDQVNLVLPLVREGCRIPIQTVIDHYQKQGSGDVVGFDIYPFQEERQLRYIRVKFQNVVKDGKPTGPVYICEKYSVQPTSFSPSDSSSKQISQ